MKLKPFIPLLLVAALALGVARTLSAEAATQPAAPHNFAKWEKEIAAYEKADLANPPPKGGLVFTGASTIRRWTSLAQDFPGQSVINRGFGGSEILDATHFAARLIIPLAPRKIYLRSGGNDLWNGKSPEAVFADFKAFVATIRAGLPDTDIVFISLSPSIARWKQMEKEKTLNALVANYVRGVAHLGYIDTFDIVLGPDGQPRPELFVADKLHFSPAGYALFAERIRPHLAK